MKPYIYITMGFGIFWLMIEVASPEIHYFLRYMATPLYAICIVVFGSYSVFKRLRTVTSPEENIEPQDVSKFQKEIREYSNARINAFAYKLSREIKAKEEKNKYNDCRHMWE